MLVVILLYHSYLGRQIEESLLKVVVFHVA